MADGFSGLSTDRYRRTGNDVRNERYWPPGCRVMMSAPVIEDIEFDEEGADGAQLVVAPRCRPGRRI